MSFFQRLMGGTFESNRDDGDEFFLAKDYGEARLSYERALRKAGEANADELARIKSRIDECLLVLAKRRLDQADEAAAQGDLQEAQDILEDILEICEDLEIATAVTMRRKKYEADDARDLLGEEEEMSEEEILAVIAGTWIDAQAEEYASLPDAFQEALLLSQDGDHAGSARLIKKLSEDKKLSVTPRYLFFELGKELTEAEMIEEAVEAFERFIEVVGDDGDLDMRVRALATQGRILNELKRYDEADQKFKLSTRIAPESYIPFFNYGVFLRSREQYERSIAALEKAAELMGQLQPDFDVVREMGNTYLAMKKLKEAEESFYAVIEHKASQQLHDQFDPLAAIPLAKIYEDKGEADKAADLYCHLASGYDTENHFVYNLEAARLLKVVGKDNDLVERYLLRASELAEGQKKKIAMETFGEFQAQPVEKS